MQEGRWFKKGEFMSNYSDIISAEHYNSLMTNNHLYIQTSDSYIARVIGDIAKNGAKEIIEIGCGPARITGLIAKTNGINLTAVDIDDSYIEYAKIKLKDQNISIVKSDICTYKHAKPVDVFYSQGVHHHLPKGEITKKYLQNVYSQLKPGGVYIISDEFVPEYTSAEGREKRLVVWYSHVIANALKNNYTYLATEEAKTLLDDIYEGRVKKNVKNKQMIDFILSIAPVINSAASASDKARMDELVSKCLLDLELFNDVHQDTAKEIALSRGDYKVCDSVFAKEVGEVGFKVLSSKSFGPIYDVGAMVVYILGK